MGYLLCFLLLTLARALFVCVTRFSSVLFSFPFCLFFFALRETEHATDGFCIAPSSTSATKEALISSYLILCMFPLSSWRTKRARKGSYDASPKAIPHIHSGRTMKTEYLLRYLCTTHFSSALKALLSTEHKIPISVLQSHH